MMYACCFYLFFLVLPCPFKHQWSKPSISPPPIYPDHSICCVITPSSPFLQKTIACLFLITALNKCFPEALHSDSLLDFLAQFPPLVSSSSPHTPGVIWINSWDHSSLMLAAFLTCIYKHLQRPSEIPHSLFCCSSMLSPVPPVIFATSLFTSLQTEHTWNNNLCTWGHPQMALSHLENCLSLPPRCSLSLNQLLIHVWSCLADCLLFAGGASPFSIFVQYCGAL